MNTYLFKKKLITYNIMRPERYRVRVRLSDNETEKELKSEELMTVW